MEEKSQSDYGLQPKERFRGKSPEVQLQIALDYAESLASQKERDEATISRMKLVTTRIKTLTLLVNRKRCEKFAKLKAEIAKLQAEVGQLKTENEKLRQEFVAAKSTTQPPSAAESVVNDDPVQKMLDAASNMGKRQPEPKQLSESTAIPKLGPPKHREFSVSIDFPFRTPEVSDDRPAFRGPTWPKEDIPSPVRNKVASTIEEAPPAREYKTVADIEGDVAYAVDLNDRYAANQRLLEELRKKQKEGR